MNNSNDFLHDIFAEAETILREKPMHLPEKVTNQDDFLPHERALIGVIHQLHHMMPFTNTQLISSLRRIANYTEFKLAEETRNNDKG